MGARWGGGSSGERLERRLRLMVVGVCGAARRTAREEEMREIRAARRTVREEVEGDRGRGGEAKGVGGGGGGERRGSAGSLSFFLNGGAGLAIC